MRECHRDEIPLSFLLMARLAAGDLETMGRYELEDLRSTRNELGGDKAPRTFGASIRERFPNFGPSRRARGQFLSKKKVAEEE
jgi:hypothetical protein